MIINREAVYIQWDDVDLTDGYVQHLKNDEPEELAGKTDDELRQVCYDDSWWWQDEWKCVQEALTYLMEQVNPEGKLWYVEGSGLGWEHRSGYNVLDLADGTELTKKFFEGFDCNFYVYRNMDGEKCTGFRILRTSHDEPMGALLEFTPAIGVTCPKCKEVYYYPDSDEEELIIQNTGMCHFCNDNLDPDA